MRFKNYIKISVLTVIISLLGYCAPIKPTVEESDKARVIERMAEKKIQLGLTLSKDKKLPNDWTIFQEVCEIYRLDPILTLESLKISNPNLAKAIQESQ